jgi:hypothetical protein
VRRRAPRGQHGLSGTLQGSDPRLIRNAQGALRDDDLGPEFYRDANGRLRLRATQGGGAAGELRLGATLFRRRDGTIDLRPADAVPDLDPAAVLSDVIATVNAILQSDRAARQRKE